MAKFVLCDTGFWIALYDKRDYYHGEATELFNKLALFHIIIPWSVLYEVLRTRFVRRREYVITFKKHLKILKIKYIDDTPYRRVALSELFKSVNKRTISLVDIAKVVITFKDRLTRTGFNFFENLFRRYGTELVIINEYTNEKK